MRAWYFTEMPYPHIPQPDAYDSVRVTLPNRYFDPKVGADLYGRYLDEYLLADDLGLDVMVNEHHATPTCLNAAMPLSLSILARQTRRARLLPLGNPIALRRDPVRVAEEMAMVDCISRGRLEVGFVRGVPTEVHPANSSPVRMAERFWEAHDLILRAWTSHDGPFSWEGKYFRYRQVNIWPRPYQSPHPPVWITGSSPDGVSKIAERDYTFATIVGGVAKTKMLFETYRRSREQSGLPDMGPSRLAYAVFLHVGETEEQGIEGARKLQWHIDTYKIAPQFSFPPGYSAPSAAVAALRKGLGQGAGLSHGLGGTPVEKHIENGVIFAGNPDSVLRQITRFHEAVGGFGHLMIMGQAGFLNHDETVSNLRLFAREVYPALKALPGSGSDDATAEPSAVEAAAG